MKLVGVNEYKGNLGVLPLSNQKRGDAVRIEQEFNELIEAYSPECRFTEVVTDRESGIPVIRFALVYSGETLSRNLEAFKNWLERKSFLSRHFTGWEINRIKPKHARPIIVEKKCGGFTFESVSKLLD